MYCCDLLLFEHGIQMQHTDFERSCYILASSSRSAAEQLLSTVENPDLSAHRQGPLSNVQQRWVEVPLSAQPSLM